MNYKKEGLLRQLARNERERQHYRRLMTIKTKNHVRIYREDTDNVRA